MDLKKKIEIVKKKIKDNAPAVIITTASIGSTVVLAIVNHRLKTRHAAEINEWIEHDKARDRDINIPDEYVEVMKAGHVGHLTNPFEDICLTIQKHDHPKED